MTSGTISCGNVYGAGSPPPRHPVQEREERRVVRGTIEGSLNPVEGMQPTMYTSQL